MAGEGAPGNRLEPTDVLRVGSQAPTDDRSPCSARVGVRGGSEQATMLPVGRQAAWGDSEFGDGQINARHVRRILGASS